MEIVQEKMRYERVLTKDIWNKLQDESKARSWLWEMKLGADGFKCRKCGHKEFWEHLSRAEVKECQSCGTQHRLRTGTIFENSKISILTWLRAIFFVTQDKRGVSAWQLKRFLGLKSMATSWLLLMKIRKAFLDRDATYKLKGIIELDGAYFAKDPILIAEKPYIQSTKRAVFVAVEQKRWVDENGKAKMKAGFAKVCIDQFGQETKEGAEKFVKQSIKPRSILKTDGKNTYKKLNDVEVQHKALTGDEQTLREHLPWVHRFISNSKRWLLGTHHGRISHKYLPYYLAEYTYRFNRRHDPNSLFHRALSACIQSTPITQPALTG
jgi:transposase-like protein